MKWLIFLGLLFLFSCTEKEILSKLSNDRDKALKEELVTVIEGVKELFCFKCHSYDRFAGGERFPHSTHIGGAGAVRFYHCNQCHKLRMHESIKTDTSVCKTCHSLGRFTYTNSGMKTYFDHASHSKRNTCRDCHPGVFVMKRGMKKIIMEDINRGRSCGVCHNGKKAFGSENCSACHEMG